jgi:hypothetical protein
MGFKKGDAAIPINPIRHGQSNGENVRAKAFRFGIFGQQIAPGQQGCFPLVYRRKSGLWPITGYAITRSDRAGDREVEAVSRVGLCEVREVLKYRNH